MLKNKNKKKNENKKLSYITYTKKNLLFTTQRRNKKILIL